MSKNKTKKGTGRSRKVRRSKTKEKMNKILVFLLVTLIVLSTSLIFALSKVTSSEERSKGPKLYSYTKAICDKDNFCQDHLVTCKGKDVVSMDAITGAFIQLPNNWKDPRNEKEIKEFCLN